MILNTNSLEEMNNLRNEKQKGLAAFWNLIDVQIDQAYINYKIKEYDLSKKICHLILSKNINVKALNLIGLCLFKEGKYKESLEYLYKGFHFSV